MLSDLSIRRLSSAQRDVLIAHIDRAVDVTVDDHYLIPTRRSLMNLGLLSGHPKGAVRPRATTLSEAGRRAVALLLGDFADALVRAGYLEAPEPEETPLMVLARLKAQNAAKQPQTPAELARMVAENIPLKPTF